MCLIYRLGWVPVVKRYPLTPTTLSLSSNHVFFLAGRWSTSGWGGNAHFFTYTRIRSRETGENKTDEQTRTKLGVTKGRGRCCNTICMCRLSLAWVTSENSTMLLESDILRLFFTGPYLMLPRFSARCLVLTAPPFFHANFSSAACLSALQPPTLLSPVQLPTVSLGRVVNSHSPPRTTSGYGEISCPRILCLVSRQNRQLNRLLWQPTHIVLHCGIVVKVLICDLKVSEFKLQLCYYIHFQTNAPWGKVWTFLSLQLWVK